ncbi:MAG: hypothetical protein PHP46_01600 [Candidatus Omnitrophica bacterium]|nr:hypothetical protein [Candidatus Omnitrophota bacterium]
MLRQTFSILTAAILVLTPARAEEGSLPLQALNAPLGVTAVPVADIGGVSDTLAEENLWIYLRGGLNYVEASGIEYSPSFPHPGGVAYGALALTPIAIRDVFQHHPEFSHYEVKEVLSDSILYEKVARRYADLLIRHYLKLEYSDMPREEIFEILQRAWYLGPGLYKKGRAIPSSRERMARQYVMKTKL